MKKKEKTSARFLQTTSKNQKVGNAQSANQQALPSKMYSIRLLGQYKRSSKRCIRRGCNGRYLEIVNDILDSGGTLTPKYFIYPFFMSVLDSKMPKSYLAKKLMTQETYKMISRIMGDIRYRLFMFLYQICLKTWLISNRICIWFMDHTIVLHFAKNIDNYMELYNFYLYKICHLFMPV
jgi:hypothetical protein